jgi:hypothetical protein
VRACADMNLLHLILACCSAAVCAGLLLVLPGPSRDHTSMKLDWRKVTDSVEWLSYVYDYQDFLPRWQGYQRWHRCAVSQQCR